MHAPPAALEVIASASAAVQLHAGDPEILAARRLQIEPHRLAVPAPPLVAVDLHVHRALVYQPHLAAVGADGPRTVELVPRPFVAVKQKVWIDGIELHVIQVAVLKTSFGRLATLKDREDE